MQTNAPRWPVVEPDAAWLRLNLEALRRQVALYRAQMRERHRTNESVDVLRRNITSNEAQIAKMDAQLKALEKEGRA